MRNSPAVIQRHALVGTDQRSIVIEDLTHSTGPLPAGLLKQSSEKVHFSIFDLISVSLPSEYKVKWKAPIA